MTISGNYYRITSDCDSTNAGDVCIRLGSTRADADGVGLATITSVSDIYIIIARVQVEAGLKPQCDVAVTGIVVKERVFTVGRVFNAADVGI